VSREVGLEIAVLRTVVPVVQIAEISAIVVAAALRQPIAAGRVSALAIPVPILTAMHASAVRTALGAAWFGGNARLNDEAGDEACQENGEYGNPLHVMLCRNELGQGDGQLRVSNHRANTDQYFESEVAGEPPGPCACVRPISDNR
jgi:hypothetical protein